MSVAPPQYACIISTTSARTVATSRAMSTCESAADSSARTASETALMALVNPST